MFVGHGIALHRAHVDTALVGKGCIAYIGLIAVVRQVGQFADQPGGVVELV